MGGLRHAVEGGGRQVTDGACADGKGTDYPMSRWSTSRLQEDGDDQLRMDRHTHTQTRETSLSSIVSEALGDVGHELSKVDEAPQD